MIRTGPAVAIGLALLVFAGCGGGGDEKKSPASPPAARSTSTATPAEGRFEAEDVAFTFEYPQGFTQQDEPNDGSVLSTVTPTPGDVNNGLKVRKTSDRELPFESYARQIRLQFEDQLDTKVTQKTGSRGDLELGVLQWTSSYTKKDLGEEKTIDLASKSYFFSGGGKTWQLECLSDQDHSEAIAEACKKALGTIEFTKE